MNASRGFLRAVSVIAFAFSASTLAFAQEAQATKNKDDVVVAGVITITVVGKRMPVLSEQVTYSQRNSSSLWTAWNEKASRDPAYEKAHPWKEVLCGESARLKIACTDSAWKKIPTGTVVYVPARPVAVVVPAGMNPPFAVAVEEVFPVDSASPTAQMLRVDKPVVVPYEEELMRMNAALKNEKSALAREVANQKLILSFLAMITVVLVLMILFLAMLMRSGRKTDNTKSCCAGGSYEKIPPSMDDLNRMSGLPLSQADIDAGKTPKPD